MTAYVVVHALNTVLHKRPESFDGLRMNVTSDIDFFAVANPPMIVVFPVLVQAVIGTVVIGENEIRWQNVLPNQAVQGFLLHIGSHECADAASPLNESDNGSFRFLIQSGCASLMAALTATEIRLIDFYGLLAPAQLRRVLRFIQHGANLLKHAPRRLVRHARLALNLLRGDAATSRSHQVDGIEPSAERSGRFVEDRASGGVNVVAATVARVGRATRNAMMFSHRFALLAIDAIWVEAIAKPFKAGRIIWELLLEVFQCVRKHFRLAVVVGHLVTYCQVKSYQMVIPTVKG